MTALPPLAIVMIGVLAISSFSIAEGFLSKSTAGWQYDLNPGESGVGSWTLTNTKDNPIHIEFRAEGKGSEYFVFEENVILESKEKKEFEFIVSIPEAHADDVQYRPVLYALEIADREQSAGAKVLINYQMSAKPLINIGDNPIFTPEPKPDVPPLPKPIKEERPKAEDIIVSEPTETIEEKLARIQAANEKAPVGKQVDDEWQESFEEEAVADYQPEPEYQMEPEIKQVPLPIEEEAKECDFFAMFLSWFGIGKCL